MIDRRRAPQSHPHGARRRAAGLVALLSLAILPLAPASALGAPVPPATTAEPSLDVRPLEPAEAAAAGESTGHRPSILYEEAMAHAEDAIAFTPGDRVSVPFHPRADDLWTVDGAKPRSLPEGRATGRAMAASAQGSRWAIPTDDGTEPAPGAPTTDPTAAPEPEPQPAPTTSEEPAPTTDPGNADPGATDPGATDPGAVDPGATPDPAPTDAAPTPAPVDAPGGGEAIPAFGTAALVPATAAASQPQAASGLRKQVLGFLPYWEVPSAGPTLDYDVLSTIAYFSVGADKDGDLLKRTSSGALTTGWSGWTSSKMTSILNAAHQKGTRVVLTLSVFAWTTSQATTQKAILGSSTARANLAKQAAAAVRDRGADGVNLDFEPVVAGYEDEFVAFVRTMRAELNRIAPGYQLTYDTTGWIGNYPLEQLAAPGAADAVFIMGYDYRTASSGYAGSIDPLSGPAYDITDTVRAYTARIPGSKVILGVPWYGRAWSTTSDAVNARTQSGTKYGTSTAVMYDTAVALAAKHGRRWDSRELSPWVAYRRENCTATYGCVTSWRQVYYDDPTSLKLRYDVVNRYGLRGAGIWALGYDGGRAEMYTALADRFLTDRTPPEAGVTMLGAKQRDQGFVVGWSAQDQSAVVAYDVQVSADGGAWTAWLAGTTATSEVFLAANGHGYAFRVRAKDAKGLWSPWNVASVHSASPTLAVGGFGRVTLDGLSYRTGPGTDAQRLGSLDAGTIVAVTAGPRAADGYSWVEVTQPIREWGAVSFVERGVWIATGNATDTYVTASRAPNSTLVDAALADLSFDGGAGSLGSAATAVAARSFSPNGDGSRDGLRLRWASDTALDELTLRVFGLDGTALGSRSVPVLGTGARSWVWDGALGGAALPDGRYVLQLVGAAGAAQFRAPSNRPVTPAQIATYAVTVDRVAPTLTSATASGTLVSPNNDGRLDTVSVAFAASGSTGWELRVLPVGSATVVRSITGAGASGTATWDGRRTDGSVAPDGRYRLELIARDGAGNGASAAREVTVDTRKPVVGSSATPASFSPNGDRVADRTSLAWTTDERASGTARIYRGTTLVRSWRVGAGTGGSVTWDGRNRSGTLVGDGRYTFRTDLRDAAGNLTRRDLTVTVDRTIGTLRWSRHFFPHDGDRLAPSAAATYRLARTATVTLRVHDAAGGVVRTVYADRRLSAGTKSWTWNGRSASGAYVAQGTYRLVLTAASSLGTTTLTRDVTVAAFRTSVSAASVRAGATWTLTFSTVEPLSTRPVVTFAQPGRSAVKASATKLADGRYRVSFAVQSGPAGSATVTISARDSGGRTNRQSLAVAVAG